MAPDYLIFGNPRPLIAPESNAYFTHFKGFFDRNKHQIGSTKFVGKSDITAENFSRMEASSTALYKRILQELVAFYENEENLPSLRYHQVEVGLGHMILRISRKLTYLSSLYKEVSSTFQKSAEIYFDDLPLDLPITSAQSLGTIQSETFDVYLLRQMFLSENSPLTELPTKASLGSAGRLSKLYTPYRTVINLMGRNRIAVKGTYLSKAEEAMLEVSFGQPPLLRSLESEVVRTTHEDRQRDLELRKKLSAHLQRQFAEYEEKPSVLAASLTATIPYLYAGGAHHLAHLASKYFPNPPEIFFTANSYMADDIYKAGLIFRPATSDHAVIQHGNLVGTHVHFHNTVEERTADKYLSWGWTGLRNDKAVVPFGVQKNISQWSTASSGNALLLVLKGSSPNWWSWDVSSEHFSYLEFISQFLGRLNPDLKQRLVIRTYLDKGALPIADKDALASTSEGGFQFSDYSTPLSQLLSKSRLVIHGYDSTGIIESIVADRPFIALLPSYPGLLKSDFMDVYETMIKTKIFFKDTEVAATHLGEISGSESDWWNSREVRRALEEFKARLARPIQGSRVKALRRAICS